MKYNSHKKRIGKKGAVLQDGVFFLIFLILIITALYGGAQAASKAGFKLGEHQTIIFNMISDGDKQNYYLDEGGRQALLSAINNVSSEPGTPDCGDYLGYLLLNSQASQEAGQASGQTASTAKNCIIDKQSKIGEIAKQKSREYAKNQIKQDFTIRLIDSGAMTTLSGSASNSETLTYPTGTYSIKPSFESSINYNLSHLKILDDAVLEMIQCKDENCLQQIVRAKSTPDFTIKPGNCEDWKTISYLDAGKLTHDYSKLEQLHEDISDCIDSPDNDCSCEIKTDKQDYSVGLENDGPNLKLTAYSGISSSNSLESITIESVQVDFSFNLIFNGASRYFHKKDGKLSLSDLAGKQCNIAKTQFRFCALTANQFYIYNDAKQIPEKKKLAIKFAVEIDNSVKLSMNTQ